jgi:outer membrane receptor protein involved in Fe transport
VTGTVISTELRAVPNAITVITAKQLKERGVTGVEQLFRGDVPGLFAISSNSDNQYDAVTMFARGSTSFGASKSTNFSPTNPIKTYIDGIELTDPRYLSQINVNSIERIEILTGPQASTIYGSNALNGVMQIFTKRGTSSSPQLTLNLQSGWVENNFSSARTPQHDYNAQLNGVEGRLAYSAGTAWQYLGPWTPSKQITKLNVFGGMRLEIPAAHGRVSADVTFRRTASASRQNGGVFQGWYERRADGFYNPEFGNGRDTPKRNAFTAQTIGTTLGYVPTSWWSHDLTFGQDLSGTLSRKLGNAYLNLYDTAFSVSQTSSDRRSLRYTTTTRAQIAALAQLSMTAGADGWQLFSTSIDGASQRLTGTFDGYTSVSQEATHNTGGFVQLQLGFVDQLYLTYGLRAEWNPNFGNDLTPNYAPRYGITYSSSYGDLTAKVRASYGRSTRPPDLGQKAEITYRNRYASTLRLATFGDFISIFANPLLSPELQQGGEGGIELYFGRRASLVITRYNQTVSRLIAQLKVDSARSLAPNPPVFTDGSNFRDVDGYGYMYQYQYLNIGNIRNQGWETQGHLNAGPIAVQGTYSYTKSRTIGIDPQYRPLVNVRDNPLYVPGATAQLLPEHTWALNLSYSRGKNVVALNTHGISRRTLGSGGSRFFLEHLSSNIRLSQNRYSRSSSGYVSFENGYAITDVNLSHQFSPKLQALMHVTNLTDQYINDSFGANPSIGREARAGFQVRL